MVIGCDLLKMVFFTSTSVCIGRGRTMCVHLPRSPHWVYVKGANWVFVGVQLKIRDLVLSLNLANGDIIVSNIINGVGGLGCVHHGVYVGEVGIKWHSMG